MTKVLLTGFEPFGTATSNPSGEIVKQISGDNIVTAILPVAYTQSADRLLALIAEHNPDVVICLGQAEGRTAITPEKVAINLDDARLADNEGISRNDVKILETGADAYFSTLRFYVITFFTLHRTSLLGQRSAAALYMCH